MFLAIPTMNYGHYTANHLFEFKSTVLGNFDCIYIPLFVCNSIFMKVCRSIDYSSHQLYGVVKMAHCGYECVCL